MGIQEDLKNLEKQINKKREEQEKSKNRLTKEQDKYDKITMELENLENKYMRLVLVNNEMTFEDFKDLINSVG